MKKFTSHHLHRALVGLTVGLMACAAQASVIFTGSSGNLAAQAEFSLTGTTLTVTLTNTSAADALVPTDILTGVFFNVAGNPALTSISALSGGNTYLNGLAISGAGTVVGGEWGYKNGLNQYGANSGISSSGLGVFGGATFPGADLASPAALDGLQYGITSAGDNLATGNSALMTNELTKNLVTFTLGGFQGTLAAISNLTFQYGTALTEPSFPGCTDGCGGQEVPEPGTLALMGASLAGLALIRRRRRD